MNFFEKKHVVIADEIDEYNHVNNVAYVQWINDIANEHWRLLIKDIPKPDYVWFIVKHEIDYKRQAKLGDEVVIKTWVGKTEGVKSIRHVEIIKENHVLVESQTTFCLLDAKSLRPKRITDAIRTLLVNSK
ncbi:Acyl-CoA thioester hydrolase [Tenacibaculum sp. 190524A02b]|uniref:acyl-CoA thioesterase n=1 Tax=Tenacibaculum vairaonense TaxID=3137860 RepID=UPI0032B2F99F